MTDAHPSVTEPPPEWAQSGSLENFALTLGKADAPDHDHDVEDQSADEPGSQRWRVVAAAKTTRVEIKE